MNGLLDQFLDAVLGEDMYGNPEHPQTLAYTERMTRSMILSPWVIKPPVISRSSSATKEEILADLLYPWDRYFLSGNDHIDLEFIQTADLPNAIGEWNWKLLSMTLSIKDIIAHPNHSWNWQTVKNVNSITATPEQLSFVEGKIASSNM